MSNHLIAGLIGFVVTVGVAVALVLKTRSYAARIVLALLLVPPAMFCVFGFAATFEPLDAVTQWTFRIGYFVVGIGLAATSLRLLFRPSRPKETE